MNVQTVLIIDEDTQNQSVLKTMLQEQYDIKIASNDEQAFAILKTHFESISAVILDMHMSGTNSYRILNQIREDKTYSELPVIATSGEYSETEEEKVLYLGARDYIVRPYNLQILKHRLSNTIELSETVRTVDLIVKDDLTPLYNKQYFMTKTRELLTEHADEEFDIVCLDIEQFKMVNDSYGIPTGDKILYKIGELLKKKFEKGAVASRFNADIFFLTVPHSRIDYQNFADTLTAEVLEYFKEIDVKLKVKICCGIYYIHDRLLPVAAMCDRASLATENIKGRYGKNVVYYKDEIRRQMHCNLAITNKMEAAIKNNEFHVYYQPKYELASECVVGAEALVRWTDKDLGFVMPSAFIPLFEKNGFITQLDMFVWETVCKDMREWIDGGNEQFSVSMNVSRADIFNPNLLNILVNLSDKYKLDRKFLHLEITESAYTDNPAQIIKVVTDLRNAGFPIEMDDFGSGYSSLNMLSEIPIDILKLDMGFVKNELAKPSGKGIIAFVISLAKWLNLAVVAEGVETLEQITILNSMECNYVQGFYFAKPLSKDDFFSLMKQNGVKEMYLTSSCASYIDRSSVRITRTDGNKIGTLLIVDDIELSRKIMRDIFRNEYDIVEAVDGEQAWQYLQENAGTVSLVLTDLLMPVMDGYQLLKRIRENEQTKDLPVVVMSQGEDEAEERVLESGADDFVSKPFNTAIIKHRIKKLEYERMMRKKLRETEAALDREVLTGLYTRKFLESRVTDFFEKSSEKDAVFIMVDVDNFKEVNDCFGHIKGDETLKTVANMIRSFFTGNAVCSRMGGDEFSIFIPEKIGRAQFEELLKSLSEKLNFMINQMHVSCSIGACVAPESGADFQTVYNNADMALLSSKRCGKNQYQIYSNQAALPSFIFYRNIDCLLDEFSDALVVYEKETFRVLYVNKNTCELVNKKKDECIGRPYYEVLWNRATPCEDVQPASGSAFEEARTVINGENFVIRSKSIPWGTLDACVQYIQKAPSDKMPRKKR